MAADTGTAKKTALYDRHADAGARIVDFAGFAMPMQYEGIMSEHRRVRETAGVFDVSHMGEFHLSGPDALATIQRLTTNDASVLDVGRVQYSAMCYEHGGFIDDLLVYRLPDRFMLVVNAANARKDRRWIEEHLVGDTAFDDVSDATALIALQGPKSEAVLERICEPAPAGLGYYNSGSFRVAGRDALVSRTGYTGEDGFEVYCRPEDATALWDSILEAGAEFQVEPVGLGCRDTLRLEMGYALYGNDIDDTRTPVESGLMWITKLRKGGFIGRDAILAKKEAGPVERLVGFELKGRGVPRHGNPVFAGGAEVGVVTSGTFSPSLERGIGMGYVAAGVSGALEVGVRPNMKVPAAIVSLPFYRDGSVRRS